MDHENNKPAGGFANLRKWVPVIAVISAFFIIWLNGWFEYFSLSSMIKDRQMMAEYVADHFFFGTIAYVAIYIVLVAISFPGASLLTIFAGFLFGGIIAGILTVFAATIGAVIIFLIARSSFGTSLEKRAGPFVKKMVDGFRKDSFLYLLTIRLTPFPFWVMNIVPAMMNMKVGPYALATFLGIIPGTFAYAYIGAGLDSIIAAQEKANPGCADAGTCHIDPSALVTREIVIAITALAVVSFIPVVIKKLRGGKTPV